MQHVHGPAFSPAREDAHGERGMDPFLQGMDPFVLGMHPFLVLHAPLRAQG